MTMSEIAKKMILVIIICVFAILIVGAALAYFRAAEFLPIALGAAIGAATSILKTLMIDRTVKKVAGMEPGRAGNYVRMQHFLRFGITGVLLVAAALIPFVNLLSAAAGVLSFQAAALSMKRFVGG